MSENTLFELIRKEEVIIWAGAGLSLYAGYPSGKKLVEILHKHLTHSEKKEISKGLLLPDYAELFFRIKSSNMYPLIQILEDTFINFIPLSTECHDKIATIPHFKTIITTNYDKLFENAYRSKAQVVFSSEQIPYLKGDCTHIFKIHGELSQPETIIIKRSDYEHFFEKETGSDIFWTAIKDRIAANSVLFLGYNLEDENIRVIFDKITNALDIHRKQCYMIAPNLSRSKKNDLHQKKIQYINSTADIFINELINNIKENIVADYESKKVSIETFRKFLVHYKVLPVINSGKDSFKLKALKSLDNNDLGNLHFSFKNKNSILNDFNDFISGKRIGEFAFDSKSLINLNFRIGGIRWPIEKPSKLILKSLPKQSIVIDIRFENGFELSDIPIKLFITKTLVEIHIDLKNATLKLHFDPNIFPKTDIDFTFEHSEKCGKVKDEIDLFTLLKNFTGGEKFYIFWNSGKNNATYCLTKSPQLNKQFSTLAQYFKNLKLIEQHFNIQFSNFTCNALSKDSFQKVKTIISVIQNISIKYEEEEEVQIELNDDLQQVKNELKIINSQKKTLLACMSEKEVLNLHGQEISLGYKHIEFRNPSITNIDSLLNGKDKKINIKSKEIYLSYSTNLKP